MYLYMCVLVCGSVCPCIWICVCVCACGGGGSQKIQMCSNLELQIWRLCVSQHCCWARNWVLWKSNSSSSLLSSLSLQASASLFKPYRFLLSRILFWLFGSLTIIYFLFKFFSSLFLDILLITKLHMDSPHFYTWNIALHITTAINIWSY